MGVSFKFRNCGKEELREKGTGKVCLDFGWGLLKGWNMDDIGRRREVR